MRRIVGDEVAGEFSRDVARRRRMDGEIGERRDALLLTALGIALVEQSLGTRLVRERAKAERPRRRLLRSRDRPAGQDARQRLDIVLRIAAIDTERVQLEDFASEILVEAAAGALAGHRIGTDRLRVVEIEQHRRMALDRKQHVGEAAEHVRPDRLALERTGKAADEGAARRHREVVAPELHEPLDIGPLARSGGAQPCLDLGEIDRVDALVEVLAILGRALVAPRFDNERRHFGAGGQIARERRRRTGELFQHRAARILRQCREFALACGIAEFGRPR